MSPGAMVAYAIRLASQGDPVTTRGLNSREIRYSTLEIIEPWRVPFTIPGRGQVQAIGALEALSLVGQISVPEALTERVGNFRDFTEHGMFYGAYGTRISGQLGELVETLKADPFSRQAVLTIFDSSRDLGRKTVDMPCTIAIQFMIRETPTGKIPELEMRVMMRSNDAWLGLTYDVVQFAALHGAVAAALNVTMGRYVHQAGSLHVYDRHLEAAELIGMPDDADDSEEYRPLFHGSSIGDISRWCRETLIGREPKPVTEFEAWLSSQV